MTDLILYILLLYKNAHLLAKWALNMQILPKFGYNQNLKPLFLIYIWMYM